jgi:uncharacterized protein (DUF302 family)
MSDIPYGYTKQLGKMSIDDARERVANALKTEGFGVLTEIDVRATLKKKIDVDFRDYKILGACNPKLAYGALQADASVGLFLPCNVIIFADDQGGITASIGKPSAMFAAVDNPQVRAVVDQVDAMIERVVAAL